MRFADVDAVTIDAFGTIFELRDPVERLQPLVPDRSRDEIERGLRAEAEYYRAHAHEARDLGTLTQLRSGSTGAFNSALGTDIGVDEFNAAFVFDVLPGVRETLARLRARGLALGVVANWDFGLHAHLEQACLSSWFETILVSAEVGARKPDPKPFHVALERLAVRPERAVHVGDHAPHDEAGARAAGMRFAAAPLATAFEDWA